MSEPSTSSSYFTNFSIMGININVGELIAEALEANKLEVALKLADVLLKVLSWQVISDVGGE